jgi:hypothetical protein
MPIFIDDLNLNFLLHFINAIYRPTDYHTELHNYETIQHHINLKNVYYEYKVTLS